jgi:hypothetical protein
VLRLVWKDVVAARWLLLAALPIYALNLAAMAGAWPIFAMIGLSFTAVLAFGSLAMEEIQGTGILWASLPADRREIVVARYLTTVLGAGLGLGISLGVERTMSAVRAASGGEAGATLPVSAAVHVVHLLLLLLVATVLLPLCFRLGAGNGVLAFSAVAVAGILLISLGGQLLLWLAGLANPLLDPGLYRGTPEVDQAQATVAWLRQRGGTLLGASALATAAALMVSAGVSIHLFETRDL